MFNNSFFYFFGVGEEIRKMESLNVSCGSDPWGDVRVDVAFRFITMRFKPTVLADAHYCLLRMEASKWLRQVMCLNT
jgi:hypothetical protein